MALEIARALVLDVQPVVLWCRLGPDTVSFSELADTIEAVTHRLPHGEVVSVATAVVSAVSHPELTELRFLRDGSD